MRPAALKAQTAALFARLCLDCGRTESETPFARTSQHRCISCTRGRTEERQARINARGVRLSTTGGDCDGANPKHLKWIRGLPCAVRRSECSRIMHPHHVRTGGTGGTAMLPADRWAVPLCATHHDEFHRAGVETFEAKYGVDLRLLATRLAALSPHLTPAEEST